jgi:hypothetical protein
VAERKTLLLRISPELWEDLNRWAAEDLRSVNGQIEFLLRRAADERFGPRRGGGEGGGESRRPRLRPRA